MKCVIALTLLGLVAAVVQAAPPVKAKAHHANHAKPVPTTAVTAKNTPSSTRTATNGAKAQHLLASGKTTGSKGSRRGRYGKSRLARASAPSYQTHPDPERYQEIQKALTDRGYLKTEPNGQWDGDSVDALKRFQADQQLDTDGKINARTLSGLGLGPKHDGSAVASAATPQPQQAAGPETNPQ